MKLLPRNRGSQLQKHRKTLLQLNLLKILRWQILRFQLICIKYCHLVSLVFSLVLRRRGVGRTPRLLSLQVNILNRLCTLLYFFVRRFGESLGSVVGAPVSTSATLVSSSPKKRRHSGRVTASLQFCEPQTESNYLLFRSVWYGLSLLL